MEGGDVIANFMAITNVTDEEVAINFLSACDFNLGEAVQLYFASEGAGGAPTTGRGVAEQQTNPPSDAEAEGEVLPTTRNEVTRLFDDDRPGRNTPPPGRGGRAPQGGLANFANFLHERFGGDEEDVFPNEGGAPVAAGRGAGNAPVTFALNAHAKFSDQFIQRHFGALPQFRLPNDGCEGRYTRRGGPRVDREFVAPNPILDAFENCCGYAAGVKKFVLMVILEGENAFPSSAFCRDILGEQRVGQRFIQNSLVPFYQVRLPNAALMVETSFGAGHNELIAAARREGGRTAAKNVERMIQLSELTTRYNLSANVLPEVSALPGQGLSYAAYPVVVLINPVTKAIVHRIQLHTMVTRRGNSDYSYDVSAFMAEVLPVLDTTEISLTRLDTDDFFLPEARAGNAMAEVLHPSGAAEAIDVDIDDSDCVDVVDEVVTSGGGAEAPHEALPTPTQVVDLEERVVVGQDASLLSPAAGEGVMKLRLRLPLGMFHVVCRESTSLRDMLLFISFNALPKPSAGDSQGSSGVATPTSPTPPASLALRCEVTSSVLDYAKHSLQCLGGFPPRPLVTPDGTWEEGSSITLKDWPGIRSGDMITVGSK